jgi:Tfp pilus assembly protein PilZ
MESRNMTGATPAAPASELVGQDVMLNPARNRRGTTRKLLILPVSIGFARAEHAGVIRDISATGLFLFSNFAAIVGEEIELRLTLSAPASPPQHVTYRARVARITPGVPGAAVGIGLTLKGTRPATALQSLKAALVLREAGARHLAIA